MKKVIFSNEIITEIIRLYNDEMLGSPSISEKLNIPKHSVLKILKDNNVKVGPSGRKFKGGKSESDKRHYERNREKRIQSSRNWAMKNKEHRSEYMKDYHTENIEKIRENKRNYERTRKSIDPHYKLIGNFRTAIYQVLKENNVNKNGHYFEVLGYSQEELIKHLEKQFIDGMTWDNYGKWHVDHIRPITSFDIKEIGDEEFLKCWGLDNLQPLWGVENIRKSNKY